MAKIPPMDGGDYYRTSPEAQRKVYDSHGLFWEPPMTAKQEDQMLDGLVKIEEAKARQAEARAGGGRSNQMPKQADPNSIILEFAMDTDTETVKLDYLLHPYLPTKCVVGFYGRGSSAKSSFVATMAAHVSSFASTLWISVEEPGDWINRAVAATAEFASVLAKGEPPFKLLCLSLPELVGFGYTLRKLIADMKPDEQSEWKQTVREACLSLLGTDDEKLRAEVRGILDDMGVLNL